MKKPHFSLSKTRRTQLLGEQRATMSIARQMAAAIAQQERALGANRAVPPFDAPRVVELLTEQSTAVHALCNAMGPTPGVNDDKKVFDLLTSTEGEALGRRILTSEKELKKLLFVWEDGGEQARHSLESAAPTPATQQNRTLAHQYTALCRHAEAAAETTHALLSHWHLQVWFEGEKLHFAGEDFLEQQAKADAVAEKSAESKAEGEAAVADDATESDDDDPAWVIPTFSDREKEVHAAWLAKRKATATPFAEVTPKRKLTAVQRRLFKLHDKQQRLFKRTAKNLQREFAKLQAAQPSLASHQWLCHLLQEQSAAATFILNFAQQLEGEGNLTPAFFAAWGKESERTKNYWEPGVYEFMSNQRQAHEHIHVIGLSYRLLNAVRAVHKAAKPFKSQPEIWDAYSEMTWRLSAGQDQADSLSRQAEAITFTQLALFRSFGLKFWQGHKGYFRYEGDELKHY